MAIRKRRTIIEVARRGRDSVPAPMDYATIRANAENALIIAGDALSGVQQVEARVFDTRSYAGIQAAIDAAHAAGGGEVFVSGSIPDNLNIVLKDKVYLNGRGIGATDIKVASIKGEGNVTALPQLSGTSVPGDRTVTFASAPGLAPGDVFIISNTTDSSFNGSRTYYRAGEFCKAVSISGNMVRLANPLYGGNYGGGANFKNYKLTPIRTGVSNMTIRGTAVKDAIKVTYGSDLVFRNLHLSGTNYAHINLSRCYSVDISDVKAYDYSAPMGYNYGISVLNSQRIRVRGVELETMRHGFVTGGEGAPGTICTVPNRDVMISDSFINGLTEVVGVCGLNLHGNSEYVTVDNCRLPSGVNPAGDYFTMKNCDVSTPAWGSALSTTEMLGTNLVVTNNVFRGGTDRHQVVRGMLYFFFGENCTRPYGVFVFANNTVLTGRATYNGSLKIGVYILMQSSVDGTNRQLKIANNQFPSENDPIGSCSVRIVTSGSDKWHRIEYVNNDDARMTPRLEDAGTPVWFEGHGSALPSFAAATGSTYKRRANAGTGAGKLYVNENGETTWVVK